MLEGKKLCARVKIEWILKQSNAMLCWLETKPMKFHEVPFLLSTLQRSTAALDRSVATRVTIPCCCVFSPRFWMHARKANKTGLRGYSQSCRYVFSLWWALPSAQRKRERERAILHTILLVFACITQGTQSLSSWAELQQLSSFLSFLSLPSSAILILTVWLLFSPCV